MTRQTITRVLFTVLCLVAGTAGAQECLDETSVVAAERNVATTAQFGLLGLLAQDDETAREIATALVEGKLSGIYKADQQVPALRARDHYGVGWWDLMKEGNARCLVKGGPPILVYRKSLEGQNAAVGAALKLAWPQCGVKVVPRCYAAKQIGKLSTAQCVAMVNKIHILDPSWPDRIGRSMESLVEECRTEGAGPGWIGMMKCIEEHDNFETLKECVDRVP